MHSHEKKYWVSLVLILAIASILRLNGINWDEGFGFTPHPDERAILMKSWEIEFPSYSNLSLIFDQSNSPWNPNWFAYGSFPIYLLEFVQSFWELITGSEIFDSRIMARSLSTLADLGTIIGTALLARACFGNKVSLLASVLVSFSVIHIQLSNFFAFDTFVTLFSIWTLFFLHRVTKKGALKDSIIAGILIGLGLASKISIFPILGVFIFAHLIGSIGYYFGPGKIRFPISTASKNMSVGLIAGLVAFVLAEPYAFLDWSQFIADNKEQSEMVRRIRDYPYTRQYIDTTPYLYQIVQLGKWAIGWPFTIIGLLGISSALISIKHWKSGVFTVFIFIMLGLVLIVSNSILMIVISSSFAFLVLIFNFVLRGEKALGKLLIISWIIPYALIVGSFEVKFTRYLLPIIPLFAILASLLLVEMASKSRRIIRLVGYVLSVLVIVSTIVLGLAYQKIYETAHPGVAASEWITENVPNNSILLKEHWEESLPNLEKYNVRELPIYDPDIPPKLNKMTTHLSESDYLIIFSNRLYGTVTRIPERYPLMTGYYQALFSGDLGFKPVHTEDSYMSFAKIKMYEDSFARTNLESINQSFRYDEGLSINGGFADESFSVYDHPKVIIFSNTKKLKASELKAIIEQNAITFISGDQTQLNSKELFHDLMMSEKTQIIQQKGGTWSEIVSKESRANQYPLPHWIGYLSLISLISFPISYQLFSRFDDKGYLLGKTVGLLAICFITWFLSSLHLLSFGRSTLWVAIGIVALVSMSITVRIYRDIWTYFKNNWVKILSLETLFLGLFLIFVLIRMMNPDLWHPYRGGEKPMDLAYLNAVVKSTYMPPYDPWFSGGYLNYYYWGQFIVASLIHLTGITTEVAYNLAIATFFALASCSAYSIGRNLITGNRKTNMIPPAVAGVISMFFVCLIGNLDGLYQVWDSIRFGSNILTDFDYWRSSRMMPPDPPGHEITEFPFFTFLFADLHAHLISIPFTLLVLGISLQITLNDTKQVLWKQIANLSFLGLAVGCLAAINTWDVPVYASVVIGALLIGEVRQTGGLGILIFFRTFGKSAYAMAISYLLFLPYHLNTVTFFNSIERTTNTTTFFQFFSIHGLFLTIVLSWCAYSLYPSIIKFLRMWVSPKYFLARTYSSHPKFLLITLVALLTITYVAVGILSGTFGGTIPISVLAIFLLCIACFFIFKKSKSSYSDAFFPCLLAIGAFFVAIGVDIWRIEGDIDRMNTVFKFYLQIWIILGITSSYFLYRLLNRSQFTYKGSIFFPWTILIILLGTSSLIYTTIGTIDRIQDRFTSSKTRFTLNGYGFTETSIYKDANGDINLSADMAAIHWLRENIDGSPVILEGITPSYRWGSRVSIHSGLPTVIGWEWHQQQQRWDDQNEINARMNDVDAIYTTPGLQTAQDLLNKYQIKYVFVGEIEKLYYPATGLEKIYSGLNGKLEKIYDQNGVVIMKVKDM